MPMPIQKQDFQMTPLAAEIGKLRTTLENLQMFGISQARLDLIIRDAQLLIKSAQGTQGSTVGTKKR